MFEQLMSCAAHAAAGTADRPWIGQIRGPGVVQGLCTDEVHKVLVMIYPQTANRAELSAKTGFTRGAIDWALFYLRDHNVIKTFGDARNPRYLRYQAMPGAELPQAKEVRK
jgi:hypothetical protein